MIRHLFWGALCLAPFAYALHLYSARVDAVTDCVLRTGGDVQRALEACAEKE